MTLPNFSKEQGSAIKTYFKEFVFVVLISSNIYTFKLYVDMNSYVSETMTKNIIEMRSALDRNTIVIQTLCNK